MGANDVRDLMGLLRGGPVDALPDAFGQHADRLVRCAIGQFVAPLFYRRVHRVIGPHAGSAAFRKLAEIHRVNGLRALAATGVLAQLLGAFEARNIAALPLKGVVLAQYLYGDMAARAVGDLDVLVDPSDLHAAGRCLRALGYRRSEPGADLSVAQERWYRRLRHEYVYEHPKHPFPLELHWRLHNFSAACVGSAAELIARARPLALGSVRLPAMAHDDLVLYLCVHGALENWHRLKWLSDLPPLLCASAQAQPERLLARARAAGLERFLFLGVALSERHWQFALPDCWREAMRRASYLPRLLAYAERTLMNDAFRRDGDLPLRGVLANLRFRMGLGAQMGYRWQCLETYLVNPTDFRSVRLPDWASFAYPLVTQAARLERRLAHGLLFLEAAMFVALAVAALWLLPFRSVAARLGTTGVESFSVLSLSERESARRIGRNVAATARRLPGQPRCLAQAIAAKWMLRRRGIGCTLYIGAQLGEARQVGAHAWLRAGNVVVTGATEQQPDVLLTLS